MAKEWAELTPDERRAERFARWTSPQGLSFISPAAEQEYRARATRFMKAFTLQKPDRVPVILPASNYPAYYAGLNLKTVMYDYGELKRAWMKFLDEFEMDTFMPPALVPPGRALDAVGYKLYKWPGHGLSDNFASYQAVENEWMMADEYDALIEDPSDFWLRTYLPRVFDAFVPFRDIPALTILKEIDGPISALLPFGTPPMQAALKSMMAAGEEILKWMGVVGEVIGVSMAMGYPGFMGGLAKAPFDSLGDTLRGTQGIMKDMFQRPAKLQEAMERLVPITIRSAVAAVNASGMPTLIMPLHKGADGFMSDKQYRTFYWPTFKKVIMGLAAEGIVPILFAEGSYNSRLEVIKELPKGAVCWYFDQTDMAEAKRVLGDTACILGNVPTSLMMTGTTQEVKKYCRKLIEVCGTNGGYVLAGGANLDEGNADNMRAMWEAAQEYGVY
jgi:hypothetical protein